MANIDRLVDVQISLNTTGIAVSNFSDMIFVAPHVLSLSRVMAITGADQLLDLGAKPSDALYRAAQAFFSQGRHPAKMFIGRRLAQSVAVTVDKAVKGAESQNQGGRYSTWQGAAECGRQGGGDAKTGRPCY